MGFSRLIISGFRIIGIKCAVLPPVRGFESTKCSGMESVMFGITPVRGF